jgi:hypothetical protein
MVVAGLGLGDCWVPNVCQRASSSSTRACMQACRVGQERDRVTGGGVTRERQPKRYEGDAVAGGRVFCLPLPLSREEALLMYRLGRAVRSVEAVLGMSSTPDMSDSELIEMGRGTCPRSLHLLLRSGSMLLPLLPSMNSGEESSRLSCSYACLDLSAPRSGPATVYSFGIDA